MRRRLTRVRQELLGVPSEPAALVALALSVLVTPLVAAALAVAGAASMWWWRLRRSIGGLTAAVLIATCWGVLVGAVAFASPVCPGATTGRCSLEETSGWALSGFGVVIVFTMLLLPAAVFFKACRFAWRKTSALRRRVGSAAAASFRR